MVGRFIPGRFPQKYLALWAADISLASITTGLHWKGIKIWLVRGIFYRYSVHKTIHATCTAIQVAAQEMQQNVYMHARHNLIVSNIILPHLGH